jgi:hypothetical protein
MKRTTTAVLLGILFMLTGSSQLLHAQRDWQYLGEANVDGQVDHDNIKVGESQGTFHAIRLRVEKASIKFDRVVVHYGNGDAVPITIRSTINPGGQTRVIDLPGDQRFIESVEFWYERASTSPDKPKVRLFGLH